MYCYLCNHEFYILQRVISNSISQTLNINTEDLIKSIVLMLVPTLLFQRQMVQHTHLNTRYVSLFPRAHTAHSIPATWCRQC